jgi:serine/threonine protein kinase
LSRENLKSRIKNQLGLHNNEFNFYSAEIIVALQMIHEKNVIYRNLTPDNIFLDYSGHIKLIDFSFSKKFNNIQKERSYTRIGTPGYLAPEVLLGLGYNYKADIWSLGIVI